MPQDQKLSAWTLRADGIFLVWAGGAAMISETVGHFLGKGPQASTLGSPYTIGGFEAHGLAILIAILLLRAASRPGRSLWHAVAVATHALLGTSNLIYWTSFVQQDLLTVGYVTTALHITFVTVQTICLRRERAREAR